MKSQQLLWEPAIYEHKAALIGREVGEVAFSSELLTEAVLAEHEVYQADFLTVGVDVYNVEAEACGAMLKATGPKTCPEIPEPLFDLSHLPKQLDLPAIPQAGRFEVILAAGSRANEQIGNVCSVRVAASGPGSIAGKLVGLEKLILALALGEESAIRILEFAAELSEAWCRSLRAAGLDVILFDSVAAPPVMSPDMYVASILPLHKRIMSLLDGLGQRNRPLIIGGDTVPIAGRLLESGATTLICDFPGNARAFAAALTQDTPIQVRRNINPQVLTGSDEQLDCAAMRLAADLKSFARPIAGTGILPYDTDPERFHILRKIVEENYA